MNDWPETSESLILRVKDPAEAAAWSAFLAVYRPVIYRLARSRGLQDADAEDLAQRHRGVAGCISVGIAPNFVVR